MTDKTELKRLADAANAVMGDARVDVAITSEDGPNQAEIDAVTSFLQVATPAAVLALIAENQRLTGCIVQRRAQAEQYDQALIKMAAERDQLKAEVERLKAENQSEVGACLLSVAENKKLQAENEALRGLYQMHKATETREMRCLKTENEALRKDAERYRWLRGQHWNESEMAVVCRPKKAVRLGFDCPSEGRLDYAIDVAMGKGELS